MSSKTPTLSIIILTHNSQQTIAESLKSAIFADEIIIVDDNSTDQTTEIIERHLHLHKNINIHTHFLHNNFSAQRNWALSKATGNWIMFLDADEIISDKLKDEIKSITKHPNNPTKGYYIPRTDFLFGREIKFGETSKTFLLRLAQKGSGKWNYLVHEEWKISGPVETLRYHICHKRNLTIKEFLSRINWYTTLRAQSLYDQQHRESFWKIFIYPTGKFLLNFIIRLGFMDRTSGLAIAWLMSWHSLLVRVKLQLLWQNQENPANS